VMSLFLTSWKKQKGEKRRKEARRKKLQESENVIIEFLFPGVFQCVTHRLWCVTDAMEQECA
jgi:hypothetical protein